jgi:hypothetical protein
LHSNPRPVSYLTLALAVATAFVSTSFVSICPAQEVASLDLTKIAVRDDLRRPKATSPVTGGYSGTEQTSRCLDSTQEVGTLRTSLVSLDRTHYQVGNESRFEATVENAGSTPFRIPFSPHLADLQPENPAQKFAYFKLQITLWIAASKQWSTNSGGGVTLYGADNHANTMLTLKPGEWVRVIGKGHLSLPENLVKLTLPPQTEEYLFAKSSLYRQETLITPTQSATASREVCLAQTLGPSVPIQLTIP